MNELRAREDEVALDLCVACRSLLERNCNRDGCCDCSVNEAVNDRDGTAIGRIGLMANGLRVAELEIPRGNEHNLWVLDAWRSGLASRLA